MGKPVKSYTLSDEVDRATVVVFTEHEGGLVIQIGDQRVTLSRENALDLRTEVLYDLNVGKEPDVAAAAPVEDDEIPF